MRDIKTSVGNTQRFEPYQQAKTPLVEPEDLDDTDEEDVELPLPKLEANLVIKTDKVFIGLSVGLVLAGLLTAIVHASKKKQQEL